MFKEFIANLKAAAGHYSTHVVWVGALLAAYWAQASAADQAYWLGYVPFLTLSPEDLSPIKGLVMFVVAFVVAKGWPQTPPTK